MSKQKKYNAKCVLISLASLLRGIAFLQVVRSPEGKNHKIDIFLAIEEYRLHPLKSRGSVMEVRAWKNVQKQFLDLDFKK